jgi:hypothetical protein
MKVGLGIPSLGKQQRATLGHQSKKKSKNHKKVNVDTN